MKKKVLQPAVLFSFVWVVVLTLHFILRFTILPGLFPLSLETYFIFFMGVLFFTLGSFIVTVVSEKKYPFAARKYNKQIEIPVDFWLRVVFLSIIIIGLPFYIQVAFKLFLASKIDDFFVGLRTEISYGDDDFGPLKYLITFSFVILGINLVAFLKQKSTINFIILLVNFSFTITYAVFATGRTFYVIILALFMGINFIYNKNFSIKKYSWIFVVFIAMFMAYGVLYGKGGDKERSNLENLTESTEVTASYLVASLSAFDVELKQNNDLNYTGNNTLRFFILIGQKLNLFPNTKAPELLQTFVFVPYSTNVYTFYSPFIKDFGKLYAWIMIGLFGAIHTLVYIKAKKTMSLRYTLYFSFLIYPLLISFFQDQYMSLFSSWVQVIFYTEIFLMINKFLASKK